MVVHKKGTIFIFLIAVNMPCTRLIYGGLIQGCAFNLWQVITTIPSESEIIQTVYTRKPQRY
ncbi:hypothetical protein AM233_09740 [Bacillus sp. FJAT-22058]|nr:hypothetical protein AM233_09740 [Bacillus sp. FJAT-22058]